MSKQAESFEATFTLKVDFSGAYRSAHTSEQSRLKPGSSFSFDGIDHVVTYEEIKSKLKNWLEKDLLDECQDRLGIPVDINIQEEKEGSIILVFTAVVTAIGAFNDIYDFIKNITEIAKVLTQRSLNTAYGNNTLTASVIYNFPKRKFSTNKEGIRIVKVAAFCFAIISFIATAEGLFEYVFAYRFQAYLISFGIQSMLFVFNLQLPTYFARIGSHIPDAQKKKRKNGITFKWTSMQKLIAVFYAVVLFSSSWFSYVFIVNVAYTDTQYIDANIILDSKYRRYLDETDRFVEEDIKLMQLTISYQLSVVQGLIPSAAGATKTKSDVDAEVGRATAARDAATRTRETAKTDYDACVATESGAFETRYWRPNEYATAQANTKSAKSKLDQAVVDELATETALTNALKEQTDWKPSVGSTVHGFLVEILKIDPNPAELNTHMANLNNMVIKMDETAVDPDRFVNIVTSTQELSIAINKYTALREAQKNSSGESIEGLKKALLTDKVTVPVPNSKTFDADKLAWESYWKLKFGTLEQIIKSIPSYSDTNVDIEVVDKKVLEGFNGQKIADDISDLTRSNLANVNKLERAFNLLGSKYPFLAWFSLLLAVYFDLASLLAGLFIYFTTKKANKGGAGVARPANGGNQT
ncbi:hypothetical protein FACS1894217_01930 [Clostridia bacterium]|nr:hypothetical protein FACS1894217_01930 [Clostridia bacterium]